MTSELSLTGYPPQDLLLRKDFLKKVEIFKQKIINLTKKKKTIFALSIPLSKINEITNALLLVQSGKIIYSIQKKILPNYGVFDEKRYFSSTQIKTEYFNYRNKKIEFLICEDMWTNDFTKKKKEKLDLIVVINASPFEIGKFKLRQSHASKRAKYFKSSLVYVNLVGSQDDLIFDGGSFVMDKLGEIVIQEKFFEESEFHFILDSKTKKKPIKKINKFENLYRALMLGLKNYMTKNGFRFAHLGLSGGIDSALTLAILADTIESENIHSFYLPSKFSSNDSKKDAESSIKKCWYKNFRNFNRNFTKHNT